MRGLLAIVAVAGGCRGREACPRCDEGETCILQDDEADPSEARARCAPIPEVCGDAVDCERTPCVAALFDLCDPGSVGGLCDGEASPAVTCYAE